MAGQLAFTAKPRLQLHQALAQAARSKSSATSAQSSYRDNSSDAKEMSGNRFHGGPGRVKSRVIFASDQVDDRQWRQYFVGAFERNHRPGGCLALVMSRLHQSSRCKGGLADYNIAVRNGDTAAAVGVARNCAPGGTGAGRQISHFNPQREGLKFAVVTQLGRRCVLRAAGRKRLPQQRRCLDETGDNCT